MRQIPNATVTLPLSYWEEFRSELEDKKRGLLELERDLKTVYGVSLRELFDLARAKETIIENVSGK